MQTAVHGGDIYRNQVQYDFSVNTNALGIPKSVQEALEHAVRDCAKYPDPCTEQLKAAIARKDAVNKDWIICGNGASELFAAAMHAVKPKKILIPVPSFYGYEWAAGMENSKIVFFQMKEENQFCLTKDFLSELTGDIDLLFLANPNNPVGNKIDEMLLEEILVRCRQNRIFVVLDECFLEFCERERVDSFRDKMEEYPNLLLVRAFTKIFAIPGVRLGYLISANEALREKIEKQLPEWNVSMFAQYAGVAAAKETDYVKKTVDFIRKEREFMMESLNELKQISVFTSSKTNFLLLKSGLSLYDILLERQILIRSCRNYRGLGKDFYRVAVRSHSENEVLLHRLREVDMHC